MTEVWKDVAGFENYYQVSNLGNVRSKERRVINHRSGSTRIVKETPINPWDNGNGYLVVTLNRQRKRKNHYVHRLVANAFLDNPENKKYINHLDYNKHNNQLTNLEWCTQKENVAHSKEHMKKPRNKCKASNTGEKYITLRTQRNKKVVYRVNIRSRRVDRSFDSLEKAISYRNEVMQTWQNQ